MDWIVCECPLRCLSRIRICIAYRSSCYAFKTNDDDDDTRFDGRDIAKVNVFSLELFSFFRLFVRLFLLKFRCVFVWLWCHRRMSLVAISCALTWCVLCTGTGYSMRCSGNVNKSPSTRLKSIYVQSIFHLCQFKLIETKWKLSADFYTSFFSLPLPRHLCCCCCRCVVHTNENCTCVFFCRLVVIVCLHFPRARTS